MLASAAKNRVIFPRLIIPAAASETSSSRLILLCIPPLACEITDNAAISPPICSANCTTKRGQRSRSSTNESATTTA